MLWYENNDTSDTVLKASQNIASKHHETKLCEQLPETALLIFMSKALSYILKHYAVTKICDAFPRFLQPCPLYRFQDAEICFLDGGRGAPQAVDTLETLAALGVKQVICMGMMGAFHPSMNVGDITICNRALSQEGTSQHYYESMRFAYPSEKLYQMASLQLPKAKSCAVVSCDAIYRQTLKKEEKWREQGCVGVDMETSALYSVGAYLHMDVLSMLLVSDIHHNAEKQALWEWKLTEDMRHNFTAATVDFLYKLVKTAA